MVWSKLQIARTPWSFISLATMVHLIAQLMLITNFNRLS